MPEVKYPEYRKHEADRVAINNSIMALLVGTRISAHALSMASDSTRLISEIYPDLEHISRYNLRGSVAREELLASDIYIAEAAIPYALSGLEDYVMSAIRLIEEYNIPLSCNGRRMRIGDITPYRMHEVLFESLGCCHDTVWLKLYHIFRLVRNSIVHKRGRVENVLEDRIRDLSPEAREAWKNLYKGREPEMLISGQDRLQLGADDIVASFAIVKRMDRLVNEALRCGLSKDVWARIAVRDFSNSENYVKNSSTWIRKAKGYINMYYGVLELGEVDIETAARDLQLWHGTAVG